MNSSTWRNNAAPIHVSARSIRSRSILPGTSPSTSVASSPMISVTSCSNATRCRSILPARMRVSPRNEGLTYIRKGNYEGLKEAVLKDPARAQDLGPAKLHPTAGATIVGAVAEHDGYFNVWV